MRTRVRVLLLALGAAALLVAGCEVSYHDHDYGDAYIQVTNRTDVTQFIYVDGDLMGSIAPGKTAIWVVEEGWHHLEASESDTGPVDPIETDCWVDDDDTFFWWVELTLLAPGAGPSGSSGEQAPGAEEPLPAPAPEVF